MENILAGLSLAVAVQLVASCCGPVKMQGYEHVSSGLMINGVGISAKGSALVTVDGESNKMSIIGNSTNNGQPVTMHVLYDFHNGKLYNVYNGACQIEDLQTGGLSTINCLPSDAKLLQSTYFGYGSEKIEVNTYAYTLNGHQYFESRTKNTCIPLSGQNKVATGFNDYAFFGLTEGIKDASVLDIPRECQRVVSKTASCCAPVKMQGYQGVTSGLLLNGVGVEAQGLNLISIDGERNMVSIIGNSTNNGKPVSVHLLYDYSNKKAYNVYNGFCQVESLPDIGQGTVNCVPADAKLLESTYYGYGSEKFEVNIYEYILNGQKYMEVRTKNTCIPVSGESMTGSGFNDWGYSGWTEGIKDASVFDVPMECRHTSPRMNPTTARVHVDPNNII